MVSVITSFRDVTSMMEQFELTITVVLLEHFIALTMEQTIRQETYSATLAWEFIMY